MPVHTLSVKRASLSADVSLEKYDNPAYGRAVTAPLPCVFLLGEGNERVSTSDRRLPVALYPTTSTINPFCEARSYMEVYILRHGIAEKVGPDGADAKR